MPGGDAREAAKTVTGSFEDLPFLPELPARGPGADMIGRTAGMLVELYARVEPSGWRFGDRPGPRHPAGPLLAARGPGRPGGVHPGVPRAR